MKTDLYQILLVIFFLNVLKLALGNNQCFKNVEQHVDKTKKNLAKRQSGCELNEMCPPSG